MTAATLIVVIAVLAVGTYSMRLVGVLLGNRVGRGVRDPRDEDREQTEPSEVGLSPALARLLPLGAVALLAALSATAALTDAGQLAGIARPAGVLAGVVAAWRRLPFVAVVVIAASVAAGLRLLGLR